MLAPKPSILDFVQESLTSEDEEFSRCVDGTLECAQLPLPAGIFLCLLMGFTTEKVLLKSEDHFRHASALKTHEVTLRSLCKVDNGNNLDCVLAQALAGSNSPEAVHHIVSGPSVKPRI